MKVTKLILKNFSTNDSLDLTSRLINSNIGSDGGLKTLTLVFSGDDISKMVNDHISNQMTLDVRNNSIQRMNEFNEYVAKLKANATVQDASIEASESSEMAKPKIFPELIPDEIIAKQAYVYDLGVEYDIIDNNNQVMNWNFQHGFITLAKREFDNNENLTKIEFDIRFENASVV